MEKIDDGYYFAPYLPIGFVPTIGNISEKCMDKDVDNTYYTNFNCDYNEK
mgnify:CR=1 FL=1